MHIRKAAITSPITTLGEDAARIMPVAAIVGLVCVGGAFLTSQVAGGFARFSHAYLTNFCFLCTIVLGSLFFVMIQHLTKAGWSVTVRRVAEVIACVIVPMAILFLPIVIPTILGYDELYTWNSSPVAQTAAASADAATGIEWAVNDPKIYELKSKYLFGSFFGFRTIIYFGIWIFIAVTLYRWSLRQDETGDAKWSLKSQAFCAPMMLLFIAALVFASFDWEMSLSPMWFSTMFPVYFFAGCVLSSLAAITLCCLMIQRSGRVTDEITVEHYHDLAKLTFAFIFFWGYIAFCQFMLIWYANFPEETFWFKLRSDGNWLAISMLLLFGHLIIPFLGIMARTVRRSKIYLTFSSIFLLAMHWVDHYWIVMPQFGAGFYGQQGEEGYFRFGKSLAESSLYFGLPEILCAIGMISLFIASFCFISGNRALVPLKDPRLHEALNYDNP